ncbi:MAG: restriction endonuclease subunit S [Candidatus Poseidoniaceae archaeon]
MIERLLSHISDSDINLETIHKIRKFVLDLAVRGKLVPQNSEEESADLLIQKLGIEPNIDYDIGYEVPTGWRIVKIGQITIFNYGKGLKKDDRIATGQIPVYGSNGIVGTHDQSIAPGPTIVIGRKGSAGAINVSYTDCWPTDVCFYLEVPEGIDFHYWLMILDHANLPELAAGLKPGLNRNHAHELLAPIPPTGEQMRIMSKVNEIFSLCTELNSSIITREETKKKLVESLFIEASEVI